MHHRKRPQCCSQRQRSVRSLSSITKSSVLQLDCGWWCCYADCTYNYLYEAQSLYYSLPSDLHTQSKSLNAHSLFIAMKWLIELSEVFCSKKSVTVYLARNCIERFLSVQPDNNIEVDTIQLLSASAFLIATKWDDKYCFTANDAAYMCDGAYSVQQVIDMEIKLLKALNYRLAVVTDIDFIHFYVLIVCDYWKIQQATQHGLLQLSLYLLQLSLLHAPMIRFFPSTRAAAAISLAGLCLKQRVWCHALAHYSRLESDSHDLLCCTRQLHIAYSLYNDTQEVNKRFGQVCALTPLQYFPR